MRDVKKSIAYDVVIDTNNKYSNLQLLVLDTRKTRNFNTYSSEQEQVKRKMPFKVTQVIAKLK